jgi:iron(III) transport system permease protein
MIVAKTPPLSNAPGSRVRASITRSRSALGWPGLGLSGWAVVVAALISLPILAVLVRAVINGQSASTDAQASSSALVHLLQTVLPGFVVNTLGLAAGVLAVVLIAGVGSAWLVAAYEFPGRGALSRLLLAPMAMPAFVMGYAYTQAFDVSGPLQSTLRQLTGLNVGQYWFPEIRSLPGAAVMLGLALFPYVYMLARPAFAERNAHLGDAARSLGVSQRGVFMRVYLPVARPAIVAGCALVLMETLADFGTVSYFAVDTLAAGIYRAWQGLGDQTAAARLSIVLTGFVLFVLLIEKRQRGRMASYSANSKPSPRMTLPKRQAWCATGFCVLWVLLGFAIPLVLLWSAAMSEPAALELVREGRFAVWVLNSLWLALLGVVVVIPAALLVAYAVRVSPHRWVHICAQIAASGYALPGVVLAVGILLLAKGLDFIGVGFLRASLALLLLAYVARFFTIGYSGMVAGLARISPRMDDSARSLGLSASEILRRVHWPVLQPSVYAATLLVFVDCLKELPATLILRPFNTDTLAVVAYQFASDERLAAAALPSLALVVVGLLPTILLNKIAARHG